uniref:BP28 C-terminal domain-containing protein n=1 Tax=Cannabis sativa TaxID=3483 RepID=A0A803NS19_CANSA
MLHFVANLAQHSRLAKVWSKDSFDLFLVIGWHLWNVRNTVVHGGYGPRAGNLLDWCAKFLSEFQQANGIVPEKDKGNRVRWTPPVVGVITINVDACHRMEDKSSTTGIVIRGNDGVVQYAVPRFSNESSHHVLISILEVLPIKGFVNRLVTKVLSHCLKASEKDTLSTSSLSGSMVKKFLFVLNKNYPSEVQEALRKFLKEKKVQSKKGVSKYDILCKFLDDNLDLSQATLSHSKLWFALHHPKVMLMCMAVLSGLNATSVLTAKATDPQGFSSVQDAILQQLHDEDLTVVRAAVSLDGINDMLNTTELLKVLNNVLKRCIRILNSSSSENTNLACDVALCCLKKLDFISRDHKDHMNTLAAMICPILLVLPKFKIEMLNWDCRKFIDQLSGFKFKALNPIIIICSFGDVPVAAQVESLHCFTYLCCQPEGRLQFCGQLLAEFPSILVPLSSFNQDVRIAAMNCVEGLRALWAHIDCSSKKNGMTCNLSHFLDKLLDLIVQQKRLILSDRKFLPSLMASLLGSSCHSLLVQKNIEQRFDQPTREKILAFILGSALKLSDYSKLMILSLLKGVGSTVVHVKELESFLSQLLRRRSQYHCKSDTSSLKLSNIEVDILCLLLENCAIPSSFDGHLFEDHLFKALQLDGLAVEDPAVMRPCVTVLLKLDNQIYGGLKTELQELLFRELVILFRNASGDIQNAAREALLRLNITWSAIVQMLDHVFKNKGRGISSAYGKKKRKLVGDQKSTLPVDEIYKGENALSFLSSFLDVLLLKKDIVNRDLLLGPLFNLIGKTFPDEWVHHFVVLDKNMVQPSSDGYKTTAATVRYIQQTLLIILEDISTSLINSVPLKENVRNEINIKVLVECACTAKDGVTRNHVFSLITTLTKITPEKVLEHIEDIFTVIGESAVTQIDNYSQHVFEDLISTIVPCWLQRTKNMDKLLQIFMGVLPEMAEHRRLSTVVYLLRILGESNSLTSLLVLLFQSLVSRNGSLFSDSMSASDSSISSTKKEWEYVFALQICEQYPCLIWLPSVVMLLQQVGTGSLRQEMFVELLFVIQFTQHKLHDPEFALKLESENVQVLLEDLMEQIGLLSQLVDTKKKQMTVPPVIRKELKDCIRAVLRTVTTLMIPSAYFNGIIRLLHHGDKNVGKKALGFLCEMLRESDTTKSRHKERNLYARWKHMEETALESFRKLCLEIVKIVDSVDVSDSLKLTAVSALEVLANRFPFDYSIFGDCLPSVTKNITPENFAVSSGCLRTTGAFVNVLGPRALVELPCIVENVIKISREISLRSDVKSIKSNDDTPTASSTSKENIILSILLVLEAVVGKLGAFLNPYLGDIITVIVLNHDFATGSYQKVKFQADTVRRLIAEKIPVRLALPPLLKIYENAVSSGDSSLTAYFGMLANLIGSMDRPSVSGYHAKIFDLCLLALDLRRQRPASLQDIDSVEKSVTNTIISLTMKLTETMFKPLFIRSIEWAESDVEDGVVGNTNVDRAVSFYGMVNKLAENHRSLFIPYFKYLLEGCVRLLTVSGDAKTSGLTRKKKARILEAKSTEDTSISIGNWHLRATILSSLHKCFLYDTGSMKFLDSSNFQVLLKPIVSQLTIEPPSSLEEHSNLPSVKEVDDLLVVCIGQMAVTAATDVLWKPLNHEVLMQTRSEKVRARILGLRVVKYLVEHLREEYLVFLAETIPFLGELLEDMEPSVKSLAQEILKEMESISGESLRQYL